MNSSFILPIGFAVFMMFTAPQTEQEQSTPPVQEHISDSAWRKDCIVKGGVPAESSYGPYCAVKTVEDN